MKMVDDGLEKMLKIPNFFIKEYDYLKWYDWYNNKKATYKFRVEMK
jgi:hypothetical protein